jgi:hypothetical protein
MGFETDALDLDVFLGTVEEYSRYVGTSGVVPQPPPTEDDEPTPPVVLPEGTLTVIAASGLNVRDVPIGQPGSQVIGWLAKGTKVKPIEVLQVGSDIWARVSEWKCAAVKYNGTWLMK